MPLPQEGAGRAPDLQYWEKTARTIVRASRANKIVVEKSTLPVRTAHAMQVAPPTASATAIVSARRGIRRTRVIGESVRTATGARAR